MTLDIKILYRRGLRLAKLLEGQRRRRLCAHRTKQMLYSAIHNVKNPETLQDDLLGVDLYLDQVELQRHHLQTLAERPEGFIIPIDLYEFRSLNKPLLDCLPGRRLSEEERKGNVQEVLGGRLFQGPEPSWIRKKREAIEHKHTASCSPGCHGSEETPEFRPSARQTATKDVGNA